MAGRKALVLTLDDVKEVIRYIESLPFKRKIQERFLAMLQGKKSMADFSVEDLDLVKKCRYEMNAYRRQMEVLARIKVQSSHSSFERDILDLAQRTDIDGYFLMLDALKAYVRKMDVKKAEAKLKNDKKRMECKQDDAKALERKKRDRENYFLGASLRKLLEVTQLFDGQNEVVKLYSLVNAARFAQFIAQNQAIDTQRLEAKFNHTPEAQSFLQAIQEVVEDPRNPFSK